MKKLYYKHYLFLILVTYTGDVLSQVKANFMVTAKKGCAPVVAEFEDKSEGTIVKWFWDFGNGNTSILKNPIAAYISEGFYTVSLIVENDKGETDTLVNENLIEVMSGPKVHFSVDTNRACPGIPITFFSKVNEGGSKISIHSWDFGDGNISHEINPKHSFSGGGNYHITLSVRDENGCQSAKRILNLVEVNPSPSPNFISDFTASCKTPLDVKFTHTGSNTIVHYDWNFGNGKSSSASNPSTRFDQKGKYNIYLKVVDKEGCVDSIRKNEFIQIGTLSANFMFSDNISCNEKPVKFESFVSHDLQAINFEWDFGNGIKSMVKNPKVTYDKNGLYKVRLIVSDISNTCKDTIEKNVDFMMFPKPEIEPIIDLSKACNIPATVFFKPSKPVKNAHWRFSGALYDISNQIVAQKNYLQEGTYSLNYQFTDSNGCEVTGFLPEAFILEAPELKINGNAQGCVPLSSVLSYELKKTKFDVLSVKWFKDKEIVSQDQVYHSVFENPGKGNIMLEVENSRNCIYKRDVPYSVGLVTKPDFEVKDTMLCAGQSQTFFNTTDMSQGLTTFFRWNFSSQIHPFTPTTSLIVKGLGRNPVSLTAFHNGCETRITKSLFEVKGVTADISQVGENCGSNISLTANMQGATHFKWIINGVDADSSNISKTFNLSQSDNPIHVQLRARNSKDSECPDAIVNKVLRPSQDVKTSFSVGNYGCSQTSIIFTNTSERSSSPKFFWYVNNQKIPNYHAFNFNEFFVTRNLDYDKGENINYNPEISFLNPGTYKILLVSHRTDCIDSVERTVVINGPEPDFTIIPQGQCAPLKVTLKVNQLDPNGKKWFDMGNGHSVEMTQTEMTYTYQNTNNNNAYTILYNHTTQGGCSTKKPHLINVFGPHASISKTINKQCDYTEVKFIPHNFNSNPNHLTYLWEPGVFVSKKEFTHRYLQAGKHPIHLTITDPNGCVGQSSDSVEITYGKTLVDFELDNYSTSCPPLKVGFQNKTTQRHDAVIVSYLWEFGDGTSSNRFNPEKVFTLPGKYSVSLTTKDDLGCIERKHLENIIQIGGPSADFSFTPAIGCVPHEVVFKTTANDPSLKLLLDFGDGRISSISNTVKVYDRLGTYIPALIISDTSGCSYSKPASEPIYVLAKPDAIFSSSGLCMNKRIKFRNLSSGKGAPIQSVLWDFNGTQSTEQHPTHIFVEPGLKTIRLEVTNGNGCKNSMQETMYIYGFEPSILSTQDFACYGDEIFLIDRSRSDTSIVFKEWKINQRESYIGDHIQFTANQAGPMGVTLFLQNAMGCDTLYKLDNLAYIGDTVHAKPNTMLHVSVVDDDKVQVKFKRSTEPDFMKYHIYRKDELNNFIKLKEINQRADTVHFIENLNTTQNSYCFTVVQENFCGLFAQPEEGDLHCSVNIFGKIDTNAAILHWNHYSGWNEVDKYIIYKENSGSFDSIGIVAGNTNTFIDSLGCYTDLFSYKVKAIEKDGNSEMSWSDSCRVKPIYFNIIPPPHMLYVSIPDNTHSEMEWVQLHPGKNPTSHYEIYRSTDNSKFETLGTVIHSPNPYFMDRKEKDVQRNNYYFQIKTIDICGEASDVSHYSKTILLNSELSPELKPKLYWTKYEFWEEDVAYYGIEQMLNNGDFIEIGRTLNGEDTFFVHEEVPLNCFENYTYRVIAYRNSANSQSAIPYQNIISISNQSVAPVKSKLYAPNAFSPNDDRLNDALEVKGAYIKSFNIKVYNRWGEQLFESNECFATWDGTYKGQSVSEGVYVYVVQATGADDVVHQIRRSLSILR